MTAELKYQTGFGNEFATEAIPGALPEYQNTPKNCPLGLYAEQLNGTAFTAPRAANQRTWLYKIYPSAKHSKHESADDIKTRIDNDFASMVPIPDQLRWDPCPLPSALKTEKTFLESLTTYAGAGHPSTKTGLAVYMFSFNSCMTPKNQSFMSADGDFLIVAQQGTLQIRTEMGRLEVPSGFICVVPRGIVWAVDVEGEARGYVCELFDGHLKLPDLGPIGANGLANPRDFEYPVAAYEDVKGDYEKIVKYGNKLFRVKLDHSPFDTVAWHGNYAPYRYDLSKFCTVNAVKFDHLDPSIFTVLTCQTAHAGVAALDFVIFPPRWMVAENTFRPPYYHRNCMSELMGLISGTYDAKTGGKGGFQPGGMSLHSMMQPHGPDAATYEKAVNGDEKPQRYPDGAVAFMFETHYVLSVTEHAAQCPERQDNYMDCWAPLKSHFDPKPLAAAAADKPAAAKGDGEHHSHHKSKVKTKSGKSKTKK